MRGSPVARSLVGGVSPKAVWLALAFLWGCGSSSASSGSGGTGPGGGAGGNSGGGQGAASGQGGSPREGGAFAGGGVAGVPTPGGGMPSSGGVSGSGAQGATSPLGGVSGVGGAGGGAPQGGDGGAAGGGGGGGTAGSGAGRVTLFDGKGLAQWRSREGGADVSWLATNDYFAVAPNSGDIATRESFGDVRLHVEFWVPATPTTNGEQDRGNSGIYLQGRYEVQVLDSYDHPLEGANDCGAIYELKNADVNAALPPESWQTYEITFRAPRWAGTQKTENARLSVTWNGKTAQTNVEVPAPTRLGDAEAPGDAPLRLQDHSHAVRYRNVWLERL